jgi:23S rRNA (guanosine2251-2'-O)-methyltransferase
MSEKDRDFQSKPRSGGQKFGGRRDRDDAPRGRPAGRGFGKRFEGDSAPRGDRPTGRSSSRPFDRDARPPRRDRDAPAGGNPYKKREFGGGEGRKPEGRRDFGGKSEGRRDFGDRPRPSRDRDGGDRPYKKREFGGSNEGRGGFKSEGRRDFGDRPRPPRDRDGGDRPYKKREFGGDRGGFKSEGRRDFGDRPSRPPRDRDGGDRPYKKREFGDRSEPRRDFKPEGRKSFGEKKPFNKDKRFNDRPQKSYERYDERPARSESGTDARAKLKSDRPSYGAPSSAYLYGIHAVTQALLNPKRIHQRLLSTQKGYESLQEAWEEARESGIALPEITYVEKEDIERLLPRDAVHQDVLLDCQPLEDTFLADLLVNVPDDACILVLDQVTDPHNVGAILRSAAAFGALGVVMQKLHAPDITGTLAKSASGGVEHVPLVREVNLSRALEQLKEAGFFCIGLAEEGKQPLAKLNLTGKTALVLGAEGAGLRRLVAENCDELVKLPTQEPIGSLNVSNAAAVALYELIRAR